MILEKQRILLIKDDEKMKLENKINLQENIIKSCFDGKIQRTQE